MMVFGDAKKVIEDIGKAIEYLANPCRRSLRVAPSPLAGDGARGLAEPVPWRLLAKTPCSDMPELEASPF